MATVALVLTVLLASWMGATEYGGYFVYGWGPAAIALAVVMMVASLAGVLRVARSGWSLVAISFFASYAAWTFLSLLWSPNRGDAWVGAGQTLLYLLAFWVAAGLIGLGASRRWTLIASALGPAAVAAWTLTELVGGARDLFEGTRLIGSVGYWNGEAAFLIVPFWVGIYLGGSRLVNPLFRALALAGAVLSVEVAVLAQSRGALVAGAVSLVVFFALSGRRLRGLIALAPVAGALFIAFPELNDVYLAAQDGAFPAEALDRASAVAWATATGAGLYGLGWGLVDRWWRPPVDLVRVVGAIALVGVVVLSLVGAWTAYERVGDPVGWGERKWEAFKSNDTTGEEQSRYLSVSGSGRYTLWQVAWEDFASHPVLGVGTHNYEATYYRLRETTSGFVRQPHLLPLEVLAERGIVGGVLFSGFLATCLAAGLWRRFGRLGPEGRAMVGALLASVTYWFVHSCAEWFWQLPAITLPAMVYLALLVSPWGEKDGTPPRWPLRALPAVLAVAAVAAVVPLYLADRYLAQSHTTTDWRAALTTVERAQDFNPVDPRLRQREAELASRAGEWSRAEDAYREAIRLNPEHYEPYYSLAQHYEARGELGRALDSYRKASSLNPLDPEIDRRLKSVETRTGGAGPSDETAAVSTRDGRRTDRRTARAP